jgi:hypothetical protein
MASAVAEEFRIFYERVQSYPGSAHTATMLPSIVAKLMGFRDGLTSKEVSVRPNNSFFPLHRVFDLSCDYHQLAMSSSLSVTNRQP